MIPAQPDVSAPPPGARSLPGRYCTLGAIRHSGPSYPLFDSVRGELRQWRTYYLDPQTAMRAATAPREVPDIGVHGENLAPFLYGLKTRDQKSFAAVQRVLRSVVPAITTLDVDLDTKRGALDIQIEQDGTMFSSRLESSQRERSGSWLYARSRSPRRVASLRSRNPKMGFTATPGPDRRASHIGSPPWKRPANPHYSLTRLRRGDVGACAIRERRRRSIRRRARWARDDSPPDRRAWHLGARQASSRYTGPPDRVG